jgi:hypothetical protein
MAVLQISRIQIRRGTAQGGSGIPQLASGELAWALDTQELWIGNGSVSEGSPAVGNTKIITQNDFTTSGNVLNLIQHIYRVTSNSIQTGPTANSPVSRTLQDRLDDQVSVIDFGAVGDGTTDDTAAIQRAINQIYLNPIGKASGTTDSAIASRRSLEFAAGTYRITSTIYIPSYTSITGAGRDKTIIKFSGTGPAIRFVNDLSTIGSPSALENTTGTNQPRNITIEKLTVWTNTNNQIAIQMDATKDAELRRVAVKGSWNNVYNVGSIGIKMNSLSSLVTCESNVFADVLISGFGHAVYALGDINSNSFRYIDIVDCYRGMALGYNITTSQYANGTTIGQQYGPRNNVLSSITFTNVKKQAVFLGLGSQNIFKDIVLKNVGCDGHGNLSTKYPQLFFGSAGNTADSIQSDRPTDLSVTPVSYVTGATKTTATSNLVTVDSISGLDYNLPILFSGVNFGNIIVNTPYWIKDILSTDLLSISTFARSGSTVTIVTETAHNLINNQTVSINSTGAIDESARLITVINTTTFTYSSASSGTIATTNSANGVVAPASQITISASSSGPTVTLTTATASNIIVTNYGSLPYIAEAAGELSYRSYGLQKVAIQTTTNYTFAFRLPLNCSSDGIPNGHVNYFLTYTYASVGNDFSRSGTMMITADPSNGWTTLSDDFNYAGATEDPTLSNVQPTNLEFRARLYDADGLEVLSPSQTPWTLVISYINPLAGDSGTFVFSYTVVLQS